jgi:hypothetical protein
MQTKNSKIGYKMYAMDGSIDKMGQDSYPIRFPRISLPFGLYQFISVLNSRSDPPQSQYVKIDAPALAPDKRRALQ